MYIQSCSMSIRSSFYIEIEKPVRPHVRGKTEYRSEKCPRVGRKDDELSVETRVK